MDIRKIFQLIAALLLLLMLPTSSPSATTNLAVPLYGQEQSQWCWNASSQMILKYYGFEATQTTIAAWAVEGHNVPNRLSADRVGPLRVSNTSDTTYRANGIKQVLNKYGPVSSTVLGRALSRNEVTAEIGAERPFVLAIGWYRIDANGVETRRGGHAIVGRGYNNSLMTVNDPWPANNTPAAGTPGVTYIVDYNRFFTVPGTYSNASAAHGNRWFQTLTTGRSLDIVFLIDSTASMGPYIAQVKLAANRLLTDLKQEYKDVRVAVVDYRDYPQTPWGSPSDYITRVRTPFTEDVVAGALGINSITYAGGADLPEAVISALMAVMRGEGIGAWRTEAERRIVLMGDAPGHDPETFPGGKSMAELNELVASLPRPIAVHAVHVGSSAPAGSQFRRISALTSGSYGSAVGAGDVINVIDHLIEDFTETPRFPRGNVAAFQPRFSFSVPESLMVSAPVSGFIEIERYNEKRNAWQRFQRIRLQEGETTMQPRRPLAIGRYRWRVGEIQRNGVLMLPSGETEIVRGASVVEEGWTEFNREMVRPGAPTLLHPSSYFWPSEPGTREFRIAVAADADRYVAEVYLLDPERGPRRVARANLRPPKKEPDAAVLSFTVRIRQTDVPYAWRVQGLNYDRRRPDPTGWTGYFIP